MYFNANCMILGSREPRTWPKVFVARLRPNNDAPVVVNDGRKLFVTL